MANNFPRMNISNQKGQSGQTFVEHYITENFKWIYHGIPVERDYGIDAYLEIVEDENVTGKQIGIQIKHGNSYFSKSPGGYKYIGEDKHLNYYLNIEQPIVLLIIDDDFNRINWVLFEIEKTSPLKRGWWIEIPENQTFSIDTKSDWKAFTSPSIDYDKIIKQNWNIDKVLLDSDFGIVSISKEEIINKEYTYISSFFKRLSKNKAQMLKSRSSLDIFFPEYDDDPREIIDIPEIREWLRDSIYQNIPWFYYLAHDTSISAGLSILLHVLSQEIDREKNDKGYLIKLEKDSFDKFLNIMFENLNHFTETHGIDKPNDQTINEEISTGLINFYCKLLGINM